MNAAVEQLRCSNTVESCAGIQPQRRSLVILLQHKLWPQGTKSIPRFTKLRDQNNSFDAIIVLLFTTLDVDVTLELQLAQAV